MRTLVTGGAGFVGGHLVRSLLADGASVLVLDRTTEQLPPDVRDGPGLRTVRAPLGSSEAADAVEEFAPEVVLHLAAHHVIPWCKAHPEETRDVNVGGTRWLLDVLERRPPRSLVLASTVAVHGFPDGPVTSTTERRPTNVYGRSKVEAEDLVTAWAAAHPGTTVAVARLSNVYGPGDRNDHLVPRICRQLGGEVVLGNLWPRRDYVYVEDVARALRRLAELPPGLHTHVVASGSPSTVEEVVRTLDRVSGLSSTVVSDAARRRADDGHVDCAPSSLAAEEWHPAVTLGDGLARTWRHLHGRTHPVVDVLGTRVTQITLDELTSEVERALDDRQPLRITFANPNYVMAARDDGELRERINRFDLVLTDGWGIMLAARMLGKRIPARLANDDLVHPLFGLAARRGASVFLLGSAPGIADEAAERLTESFPGLRVVGTMHGFLDVEAGTPGHYPPEAVDRMVSAVAQAKPDVLVVGLPTPNQQRFVVDNADRLDVPVVLTGGSWIDHLAERLDFYPPLVTTLGLRWAYRWAHEPRRLAHRYTVELAAFGRGVLRQRRSRARTA